MTANAPASPPHPTETAHRLGLDHWTANLTAYGPAAFSREAFGQWASACGVWGEYVHRLSNASGPVAVFEAGSQLLTDSLEICSRTAATRLHLAGVQSPLLNDA